MDEKKLSEEIILPKTYCYRCRDITDSVEPIIIQRINLRFKYSLNCKECKSEKSNYVSKINELTMMPVGFYHMRNMIRYHNYFTFQHETILFKHNIKDLIKQQLFELES